jgi:hypothetical protein
MSTKKLSAKDQAEIQKYVQAMTIEASTPLLNGSTLTAKREKGSFSWFIDGVGVSLETAQEAMISESSKDVWVFTATNGESFEMRRPNAQEKARQSSKAELNEWNAKVEAKKLAKKQAKKDRLATHG